MSKKSMESMHADNIQKKTFIVEFMDDYRASLADFTPWIALNGGTIHIEAMGNAESPYIWYITTNTPEKTIEFLQNAPATINGFDVLIYRPWDKINRAKILWVPHWILATDIKKAIRDYVSYFLLRRCKHTDIGFHSVLNTGYNLYSAQDLSKLPVILKIKSAYHDHLVYSRVSPRNRLDWNEILSSYPLSRTFGEKDDSTNARKPHSGELDKRDKIEEFI